MQSTTNVFELILPITSISKVQIPIKENVQYSSLDLPFLSAKKLLPEGSVVTLLSFFIFLLLSLCTLLIHHNLRLRFSLYKKLVYMYKKVLSSSYNNSNQK